MKAVRFHQTGRPEVLVYEDVPTPTPNVGEVLIRVAAAGLNYADVMHRRGDDYPEQSPHRLLESRQTTGKVVLRPWVEA